MCYQKKRVIYFNYCAAFTLLDLAIIFNTHQRSANPVVCHGESVPHPCHRWKIQMDLYGQNRCKIWANRLAILTIYA